MVVSFSGTGLNFFTLRVNFLLKYMQKIEMPEVFRALYIEKKMSEFHHGKFTRAATSLISFQSALHQISWLPLQLQLL